MFGNGFGQGRLPALRSAQDQQLQGRHLGVGDDVLSEGVGRICGETALLRQVRLDQVGDVLAFLQLGLQDRGKFLESGFGAFLVPEGGEVAVDLFREEAGLVLKVFL